MDFLALLAIRIRRNQKLSLENQKFEFESIGTFNCKANRPYEMPRQGVLEQSERGYIQLNAHRNFEQCVRDLEGFDRIWIVYVFHISGDFWHPMVHPPRCPDGKKKSLFATRSPHRPNPIGMSCVKIHKIKGLKIWVEESDLLDQTPILDIKPYIPYADSFPNAQIGWLENIEKTAFELFWSDSVLAQLEWLKNNSENNLKPLIHNHLEYIPLHTRHKRVHKTPHLGPNTYVLALKIWRIVFRIDEALQTIHILELMTGFKEHELDEPEDPFNEKDLHKAYIHQFGKLFANDEKHAQ